MSNEAKINKCPVCGSDVETGEVSAYVMCSNLDCMLEGPVRDTKEQAIAAWNRLSYKAPVKKKVVVCLVRTHSGHVQAMSTVEDLSAFINTVREAGYTLLASKDVEFEVEG